MGTHVDDMPALANSHKFARLMCCVILYDGLHTPCVRFLMAQVNSIFGYKCNSLEPISSVVQLKLRLGPVASIERVFNIV
jgi:hypothetical protein